MLSILSGVLVGAILFVLLRPRLTEEECKERNFSMRKAKSALEIVSEDDSTVDKSTASQDNGSALTNEATESSNQAAAPSQAADPSQGAAPQNKAKGSNVTQVNATKPENAQVLP